MRPLACWIVLFLALTVPAAAQPEDSSSVPSEARKATSDERAAEVKSAIDRAKQRQQAMENQNDNLWIRWTYAVCLGCGPIPKNLRVVRTNPTRVLAGIPAAADDARRRAQGSDRSRRRWASSAHVI